MIKPSFNCNNFGPHPVTRREMLSRAGAGFGGLALAGLLGAEARANPLAVQAPHFAPRAKRVIFLFMHGGPSQVDTFDYKPALQRDHGKPYPGRKPRIVSSATANLLASPFKFKQHGQSGRWVSEIFPHVGAMADELCFVNSVHCSNSRHGGALLELHTGSDTFVRPSMGSWITYGLGTENENLPGYITICPTQTHGGMNAWSSAFLPAHYHGTRVGLNGIPAAEARIPFIENKIIPRTQQRRELDLLAEMNAEHLAARGRDDALETRIASFELAFRMQREAPRVQDISTESEATKKLYGMDNAKTRDFGTQCLLARRFAEAGVRFVQATHSYKWDAHGGLEGNRDARFACSFEYFVAVQRDQSLVCGNHGLSLCKGSEGQGFGFLDAPDQLANQVDRRIVDDRKGIVGQCIRVDRKLSVLGQIPHGSASRQDFDPKDFLQGLGILDEMFPSPLPDRSKAEDSDSNGL